MQRGIHYFVYLNLIPKDKFLLLKKNKIKLQNIKLPIDWKTADSILKCLANNRLIYSVYVS